VLPFVNLSTEADTEYFSDGLTEDLIHALSCLHNLRVVSRTSAFEFKAKPQSIRKIGAQLKVSTVVEGSVRKVGQKLRVSVQLVNALDGYCLWSQRWDREMKDVFEIQDEIAQTIAETLKVKLRLDTRAISKRRTEKFEAYDLYLRGRFQWNKRNGEGFDKALEQDPNYAPAYSGIADHHIAAASWGLETVFHYRREYDRSLAQCRRALELDPDDVELHVVEALNYEQKRTYSEAIQELEKARELSGNNPLILGPLGSCYGGLGEKAKVMQILEELERASQASYVAPITWVMIYLGLQDRDRAFDWLQRAAEARDALLCYLGVGPIYDGIRNDPRYEKLMKRIGLASSAESTQALTA